MHCKHIDSNHFCVDIESSFRHKMKSNRSPRIVSLKNLATKPFRFIHRNTHQAYTEPLPPLNVEPKMFGIGLIEHLRREQRKLPLVLVHCCAHIEEYGLEMEGVYRVNGRKTRVDRFKMVFERNMIPDELTQLDQHAHSGLARELVNDACSLVKQYFRELPIPLIPSPTYRTMMDSLDKGLVKLGRAIQCSLHPSHYRTLRHLMMHLHLVSTHSAKTMMNGDNLAMIWMPTLMPYVSCLHSYDAVSLMVLALDYNLKKLCFAEQGSHSGPNLDWRVS